MKYLSFISLDKGMIKNENGTTLVNFKESVDLLNTLKNEYKQFGDDVWVNVMPSSSFDNNDENKIKYELQKSKIDKEIITLCFMNI